ncbi:MAG TPA: ATP-binding cassette domain-containing protein [Rhodocyclaceae bacterium]|nr:ATP-binding cassette domain-containing protein [Rhodocyclaceae bacterium]
MIRLQDLSVDFEVRGQRLRAVDGVSLAVAPGEVFGIVGASGAGKSTLLRTINLLERPQAGRVVVDGRDITDLTGGELRRERQKIGMIFQHFNLMHTRTVFDNAAYAMRVAGRSQAQIRRHVPEILRLVGLEDKADAYPSQLSGGQKQRVGIARAVANHPQVLLCDEPTSALDLETSAAILDLLQEINRRLGITIVLISHEMAVIKKICTRVAVMEGGRIVEQGDAYDVFATPRQPFTRQLVERTFNLDLPPHIAADAAERQGVLLKVLFLGKQAEEGILCDAAVRHRVAISLLHGRIEYIGHRPIGLLVLRLTDGPHGGGDPYPQRLATAMQEIAAHAAQMEVLHA